MKKKITIKDWNFIGKCNPAQKWCRCFCNYYLIKRNDNMFVRKAYLSWFAYIIIFIPIHVLQIFTCMWDGGIKEFTILDRYIGFDYIYSDSLAFSRAKEIWDKYERK